MSHSLLSKPAIRRHMENGAIVISPFDERNLGNCSYDVTLGQFYYRETPPIDGNCLYNPWDENCVNQVWGCTPIEAESLAEWKEKCGNHPSLSSGIHDDDRIIWLAPGETILGHTEEFIGGRETVTTMMKARSSLGRNFITVCKCAGWGDVGYINRWTMEITNSSRYYHIPLVVGRRVAQIAFFEVERVDVGDSYDAQQGKYQNCSLLEDLEKDWKPSDMLPRMYLDREVREVPSK